jgi:molybdate transport system ATP-binding protein
VRRQLQDQIDEVRQSLDIPLILVTHDFDDVVRLATHLLILERGVVVEAGPLQSLTNRPDLVWLREAIGLGSLIEATVARADTSRGLVELAFDGGTLVAPGRSLAVGTRVRVRIPGREVILATTPPRGLSLHNVLLGSVTAIHSEPQLDQVVVQVAVGNARILAEVTRDAVAQLGIVEGSRLHALIKSVSLEVQPTLPLVVEAAGLKTSHGQGEST